MLRKSLFAFVLLLFGNNLFSQCVAAFSFTSNFDTLSFSNTSTGNNLRFYWNFGDGRTSYDTNPIHGFPESGRYLVALYVLDTVSYCHTDYKQWINVTYPSTDSCQPYLNDTIFTDQGTDFIYVSLSSINCNDYHGTIDTGPAMNFPPNNWIGLWNGWHSAIYLSRVQYYTNDTVNGYALRREYYKTRPYKDSIMQTYDSCSANFEYYIEELQSGAMVHLKAMNPYAQSYEFVLTGMGNPIIQTTPDAAFQYNYVSYEHYFPWLVGLNTTEASGCKDTVWQTILIRNPYYESPPNCAIATEPPLSQVVTENDDVQFIISTDPRTTKQWYMDDGTGFTALTNAGPFSGVTTDTLTVSRVTYEMNNYIFSCDVSSNTAGCGTSSNDAQLIVVHPDVMLYPNPTDQYLTFEFTTPDTISTVSIYNLVGEEVLHFEYTGAQVSIDLGILTSGIYIAEVKSRKKTYRKKFIKTGDIR